MGPGRVRDGARAARLGRKGDVVVGSQVVRLMQEQSEDLTARVGVPLELVGVAVRRPNRHPEVSPDLLTTDAASLVERVCSDCH